MAITYVKDIPDFNKKVNELTDITDVKDDIEEIQGDVTTLAGAVTALDEEVDGLSASNIPYSETQSIKQKIDSMIDNFVVLDDSGFTWNSDSNRFSMTLSLTDYKAIIVNSTNGAAVMGAFYSSQNSTLYVYGFIPSSGTSIDDAYHFSVLIIK